jgi:hypothetical protein
MEMMGAEFGNFYTRKMLQFLTFCCYYEFHASLARKMPTKIQRLDFSIQFFATAIGVNLILLHIGGFPKILCCFSGTQTQTNHFHHMILVTF